MDKEINREGVSYNSGNQSLKFIDKDFTTGWPDHGWMLEGVIFEEFFHAAQDDYYEEKRSKIDLEVEAKVAKAFSGESQIEYEKDFMEENQDFFKELKKVGDINEVSKELRESFEFNLVQFAQDVANNYAKEYFDSIIKVGKGLKRENIVDRVNYMRDSIINLYGEGHTLDGSYYWAITYPEKVVSDDELEKSFICFHDSFKEMRYVNINYTIDTNGVTKDIKIMESQGDILDSIVISRLTNIKLYSPALIKDKKVNFTFFMLVFYFLPTDLKYSTREEDVL